MVATAVYFGAEQAIRTSKNAEQNKTPPSSCYWFLGYILLRSFCSSAWAEEYCGFFF
jgi:hypothetical protein